MLLSLQSHVTHIYCGHYFYNFVLFLWKSCLNEIRISFRFRQHQFPAINVNALVSQVTLTTQSVHIFQTRLRILLDVAFIIRKSKAVTSSIQERLINSGHVSPKKVPIQSKELNQREVESKMYTLLRCWWSTNASMKIACKSDTFNRSSFLDPSSLLKYVFVSFFSFNYYFLSRNHLLSVSINFSYW